MKDAMEMVRGRPPISIAAVISPVHTHTSLFVWRSCAFALLCGVRVLCSFVSCKRQTGQRTCRQAPSQEIRQANICLHYHYHQPVDHDHQYKQFNNFYHHKIHIRQSRHAQLAQYHQTWQIPLPPCSTSVNSTSSVPPPPSNLTLA